MRLKTLLPPLLALPLALSGCGVLGIGSATPGGSAAPTPEPGGNWLVVAGGSASPSPTPSARGTRSPALPPVTFLPLGTPCTHDPNASRVLIPLHVQAGAGSLTVTWPRQAESDYRITAVKQTLVSGNQPPYTWQDVPAGSGCTITATIKGLTASEPYIVWLDATSPGYERDGTRRPYSGRSEVVYPQ